MIRLDNPVPIRYVIRDWIPLDSFSQCNWTPGAPDHITSSTMLQTFHASGLERLLSAVFREILLVGRFCYIILALCDG